MAKGCADERQVARSLFLGQQDRHGHTLPQELYVGEQAFRFRPR
jgi:hypothetical protein